MRINTKSLKTRVITLTVLTVLSMSLFTACGKSSEAPLVTDSTVAVTEDAPIDSDEPMSNLDRKGHQAYEMVNYSEQLAKRPELQEFMYSLCDGENETSTQNRWTLGFTNDQSEVIYTTGNTESFEALYAFNYNFTDTLSDEQCKELAEILSSYYTDLESEDFQTSDTGTWNKEKLAQVAIWVAWNPLNSDKDTELNWNDSLSREDLIVIIDNIKYTKEDVDDTVANNTDKMKDYLKESGIDKDENFGFVAMGATETDNFYIESVSGLTEDTMHQTAKNCEFVYVFDRVSGQSTNTDIDLGNIGVSSFEELMYNAALKDYKNITGLSANESLDATKTHHEQLLESITTPNDGMPEEVYQAYQDVIIGSYAGRQAVLDSIIENPWNEDLTKESIMEMLYDITNSSISYQNLSRMVYTLIYGESEQVSSETSSTGNQELDDIVSDKDVAQSLIDIALSGEDYIPPEDQCPEGEHDGFYTDEEIAETHKKLVEEGKLKEGEKIRLE